MALPLCHQCDGLLDACTDKGISPRESRSDKHHVAVDRVSEKAWPAWLMRRLVSSLTAFGNLICGVFVR